MRVLHLFSNSKWTGPAEPALTLCLGLRNEGIDVDFACAPFAKSGRNKIVEVARDNGLEPIASLRLKKHRNPIANFLDRRELRRLLRESRYDLVHCHLDNDHRIAVGPAQQAGVPVVRSSYEGTGFLKADRMMPLLARTSWIIEPSQMALEHDAVQYGFSRDRMTVVPTPIDTTRFDPIREVPDGRRWLNLPSDAFVVGIVARMQPHRRFEDFWAAVRQMVDNGSDIHVIVVGRGTRQETVGKQPVHDLGLDDRVHFAGFIEGENYVGMLKAFDAGVYLVPGTDGTCRAVREMLAMAKPVVVADRGMLREIVHDGETGCVVEGSSDSLANALTGLENDRARRRKYGEAARTDALDRFSLKKQVGRVAEIYDRL